MRRRVTTLMMVTTAVVLALCTAPVEATVQLRLSEFASNTMDPSVFDATMGFTVVGTQLPLTVVNLTSENPGVDPELKINEIYFNASANVTALTLDSAVHSVKGNVTNKWPLIFDVDNIIVNSFGLYDVSLIDGTGNQQQVIGPYQESVTFTITINNGVGSFLDTDFIQLSTLFNEHTITVAAAKFYNDAGDISGYGAVPEPATILLLGLGALALLRRRRP